MSLGLTEQQKRAYDAILVFVAHHGAVPSVEALAHVLNCCKSNAWQLVDALHERGYVHRSLRGQILLGTGGVSVVVPADVAARLAQHCHDKGELISAVVADAVLLHLDVLAGVDPRCELEGT